MKSKNHSNGKVLKRAKRPPAWKASVSSYFPEDLKVIKFEEDAGIKAAINLLWDRRLGKMPFDLAGADALAIPAAGVHFFEEAGLRFTVHEVLDPQKLTAEEWREIRKQNSYF